MQLLGRKKSSPEARARALQFANYVKPKGTLTPKTPPVDWYSEVYSWPMYSNDTLGDCVCAALGHLQNLWSKYATGVENVIPDSEIVAAYNVLSPQNDGVDMLTALQYMESTGIDGHKIAAYVALEPGNIAQAQLCIELFGAVFIGIEIPDAITSAPNMLNVPWDPPAGVSTTSGKWAPDPNNGHCIIAPGYLTGGSMGTHFPIVTWGQLTRMSESFYQTYSDEAYGVISADWIKKNGVSPSGFDLKALLADRAAIANA